MFLSSTACDNCQLAGKSTKSVTQYPDNTIILFKNCIVRILLPPTFCWLDYACLCGLTVEIQYTVYIVRYITGS